MLHGTKKFQKVEKTPRKMTTSLENISQIFLSIQKHGRLFLKKIFGTW